MLKYHFEQNRIFASNDNGNVIAEITFPEVRKGVVNLNHTFVDSSLRGQGIASQLVEIAYHEIKKQGNKAIATCSYVIDWFARHKEYQDVLIK
ncbi:MAG: hypothetical protein K0R71_845 [Bacillales bacterium]|nr:hypothetical protein [Bacillales bacterium]